MKQYLLHPFGNSGLNDTIFESPYGILRDLFGEHGIHLSTYDLGDVASADMILSQDHHPSFLKECQRKGVQKEKLVLLLYEPAVVRQKQYSPSTWKHYGTIFTYRDDLVDNKKIFKMRYPQGQSLVDSLPAFHERKFLTLINANKYSYVQNELYSYRRAAIRYFENQKCGFDLYGHGWNNNSIFQLHNLLSATKALKILPYLRDLVDGLKHYTSYRGTVEDKARTLASYKFALSFENEKEIPGWISEKMFDCFFAGSVPIYLGANNVTDSIPAECFIDMRHYDGFPELSTKLTNMGEEEFTRMQSAGQQFIRSKEFLAWTPRAVFQEIVDRLV